MSLINTKLVVNMAHGDIALAENLDQAVDAWRSNGQKYHPCFTPDGDLVDRHG